MEAASPEPLPPRVMNIEQSRKPDASRSGEHLLSVLIDKATLVEGALQGFYGGCDEGPCVGPVDRHGA
jgi:hypothetical protein